MVQDMPTKRRRATPSDHHRVGGDELPIHQKVPLAQRRFPTLERDSGTARHNHDTGETGQRWVYQGYSEKADHYHLWRCQFVPDSGPHAGKMCGATMISPCRDKLDLNRGLTESMRQGCGTCKSLRRRHDPSS
jgi:hypothetical protein